MVVSGAWCRCRRFCMAWVSFTTSPFYPASAEASGSSLGAALGYLLTAVAAANLPAVVVPEGLAAEAVCPKDFAGLPGEAGSHPAGGLLAQGAPLAGGPACEGCCQLPCCCPLLAAGCCAGLVGVSLRRWRSLLPRGLSRRALLRRRSLPVRRLGGPAKKESLRLPAGRNIPGGVGERRHSFLTILLSGLSRAGAGHPQLAANPQPDLPCVRRAHRVSNGLGDILGCGNHIDRNPVSSGSFGTRSLVCSDTTLIMIGRSLFCQNIRLLGFLIGLLPLAEADDFAAAL